MSPHISGHICKYAKPTYNERKYPPEGLDCNHNFNRPKGCSWGSCIMELCPLLSYGVSGK